MNEFNTQQVKVRFLAGTPIKVYISFILTIS